MVVLSQELYELGNLPMDVEKNAKEELADGAGMPASRQRGRAVVRTHDGWFRTTSLDEIEMPARASDDRDSIVRYSTSQTPPLDIALQDANIGAAKLDHRVSQSSSEMQWSGSRS